jgi:LPS sulfotransferase NodH
MFNKRREREHSAVKANDYLFVACALKSDSNLLCSILKANGFDETTDWLFDSLSGSQRHQSSELNQATVGRPIVIIDWPQFQLLRSFAADSQKATSAFQSDRYILVSRRDLAAQAVSKYANEITSTWMGEGSADYEGIPEDFDAIYAWFAALAADAFAWEDFFRSNEINPIRVYCEDMLSANPSAWENLLRRVAPDLDRGPLDLIALKRFPPEHERVHSLMNFFREQLVVRRRPRSLLDQLKEIGDVVARVERTPWVEGVLGRFAGDMIGHLGGFRLRRLDLRLDMQWIGPVALVSQQHFLDGGALRLDPGVACSFSAPMTRVMLQFYSHAWSGIAEIRLGDTKEELDLFSERPGTRNFIRDLPSGFQGPVDIRPSKTRHLLSQGSEVWLQRALVLCRDDE